jgi:hypothetical protein
MCIIQSQVQPAPAPIIDGADFAPHLFWYLMEFLGLGHSKSDPRYAGLPARCEHGRRSCLWPHIPVARN